MDSYPQMLYDNLVDIVRGQDPRLVQSSAISDRKPMRFFCGRRTWRKDLHW